LYIKDLLKRVIIIVASIKNHFFSRKGGWGTADMTAASSVGFVMWRLLYNLTAVHCQGKNLKALIKSLLRKLPLMSFGGHWTKVKGTKNGAATILIFLSEDSGHFT
jgi:hypothetical protein